MRYVESRSWRTQKVNVIRLCFILRVMNINQRKHDLLNVSVTMWKVRVRIRETSNSGSRITHE